MTSHEPSEMSDAARQILHQYNECGYNKGYSHFQGPHYVTWERGEFYMRPFGGWARHRYSFHCHSEFVAWQEDPLWIFEVMC